MWRIVLTFCLLVGFVDAASASWEVRHTTDPMTDKTTAVVTVYAKNDAAAFRISCLNGRPFPAFVFRRVFGFGRIGTVYRFDNHALVYRIVDSSSDGREVLPWLGLAAPIKRFEKSKRFRIQFTPYGRSTVFLDFDLTGAKEAIEQVKCR